MLSEYGKIVFQDRRGRLWVIQPRSFYQASSSDKGELNQLLFSGEYVITRVAMPNDTKEMKGGS